MLLFALSCSDYQLNSNQDVGDPFDSGYDDICDNLAAEAGEVDMLEECIIEPVVGGWTPVLEWANEGPGDTYTTPVVGHLDGDDNPEVVVANTVGVLYVLDGVTGEIEWSGGGFGSEPMTAAIGDLDGDGLAEVVGSGSYGTSAYRGDGTLMWQTSATPAGNTPQCGAVGIHDLDGDGLAEVVIGNLILNGADGSTRGIGGQGARAGATLGPSIEATGTHPVQDAGCAALPPEAGLEQEARGQAGSGPCLSWARNSTGGSRRVGQPTP